MACRSSSRRLCSGESTKRKRSLRQERHSLGQVLRNELRMSRVIFSRIARLLPGAPFLPLPRGSVFPQRTQCITISPPSWLLEVANRPIGKWYSGLRAFAQLRSEGLVASDMFKADLRQTGETFEAVRIDGGTG